jgi:DMSO/TMAO reductase YedYZ molybdopterin-dependent catalytic subunit
LEQSILSGSLWVSGLHNLHWPGSASPVGSLVGIIPFSDEGRAPFSQPLGEELDGRLFTNLSLLSPENAVTPLNDFYIRTRASNLLEAGKHWTIGLGGFIEKPITLHLDELSKSASPMGLHLMECAGNSRSAHFGLLSVAEWDGIPIAKVLQNIKPSETNYRVLISGFDHYSQESNSSVPGASWIFTFDQLQSSGAFLATKMNGQQLTPDHGYPVRLFVPGWYGCSCIKWVNEISFVSSQAPATSQMMEYAGRTMQEGIPKLAQEYRPATMDVAAMPIRIEKWFANGKIEFHVVGIQWGGAQPIDGLEIQFNANENYVPVAEFHFSSISTWNFWKQIWTPSSSGRYLIRLRPQNSVMEARRLRSGYYARSVDINDI